MSEGIQRLQNLKQSILINTFTFINNLRGDLNVKFEILPLVGSSCF